MGIGREGDVKKYVGCFDGCCVSEEQKKDESG